MALVGRVGGERVGGGNHLGRAGGTHRRGPQSVVYALLSEFVLRVEVKRGSKLGQRLDLPAIEQVAVSALQMQSGQMLPCHLTRGEVLHVLRDQASRFLEFVEGLVEILQILVLRFLELEAARESLAGGFQVFDRTFTGGRARRARAKPWGPRREGPRAPDHTPAPHNTS